MWNIWMCISSETNQNIRVFCTDRPTKEKITKKIDFQWWKPQERAARRAWKCQWMDFLWENNHTWIPFMEGPLLQQWRVPVILGISKFSVRNVLYFSSLVAYSQKGQAQEVRSWRCLLCSPTSLNNFFLASVNQIWSFTCCNVIHSGEVGAS